MSTPECTCVVTAHDTKFDENCHFHRKGGPMHVEFSPMHTGFSVEALEAEWDRLAPKDAVHVIPISDLIGHTDTDDCPCGPTSEPVKRGDGSVGWLHVHHSLDGREGSGR